MAEAKVTGPGVLDMKLLAARLKEADPVLKRELRRNFRDAAEPVAGDVQQSILLMPSHHGGTLRREVAKTVAVRTSFTAPGSACRSTRSAPRCRPGKDTLPHHLDSAKGWNHPVYARGPEAQSRSRQHLAGQRPRSAGMDVDARPGTLVRAAHH